jgi:co-chaperonin GroES (HSP10)
VSKYLEAFRQLSAEFPDFLLQGDRLLVEEIRPEEIKTQSGIVMASSVDGFGRNKDGLEANRAIFARVLAAGPGFLDNGDAIKCEVAAGDVVMVSPNSILWFSTFLNNIATLDVRLGLTREQDVHLHFRGDGTYDAVRGYLKGKLEATK